MRWNGDLEAFLDWFMSSGTNVKIKLTGSLMSVPNDSWWRVWTALTVALDEAKSDYLPLALDVSPSRPIEAKYLTEEDLQNYDLLDEKERFLYHEMVRRQRLPH